MMKKLMILSLVLGTAAIVNAGLVVEVTPADPMSGTISVGVDVDVKGYELVIEVIEGDLVLDGSGVSFGFKWDFDNNVAYNTPALFRVSGSQFFGNKQGPGTLLSGLVYEGIGTIQITDLYNAGFEPMTVVIPEPMTMGLLGLGALFLRRRK